MAAHLRLRDRQADPFGPKNQSHRLGRVAQLRDQLRCSGIRVQGQCCKFSGHARRGQLHDRSRQRLIERLRHLGRIQQVMRAGGKGNRLRCPGEPRLARLHDHQAA